MQIHIRDAEAHDLDSVLELMRRLAEQEGLAEYFRLTREALAEGCLGNPKRFHLLVAASETGVVGYATYLVQFSPWAAREYLLLDDLYVGASDRGTGVGSRLMERVGEIALERDVDVRWHVERDNQPALRFYAALGAEVRDKYIAYWSLPAIRAHRERK